MSTPPKTVKSIMKTSTLDKQHPKANAHKQGAVSATPTTPQIDYFDYFDKRLEWVLGGPTESDKDSIIKLMSADVDETTRPGRSPSRHDTRHQEELKSARENDIITRTDSSDPDLVRYLESYFKPTNMISNELIDSAVNWWVQQIRSDYIRGRMYFNNMPSHRAQDGLHMSIQTNIFFENLEKKLAIFKDDLNETLTIEATLSEKIMLETHWYPTGILYYVIHGNPELHCLFKGFPTHIKMIIETGKEIIVNNMTLQNFNHYLEGPFNPGSLATSRTGQENPAALRFSQSLSAQTVIPFIPIPATVSTTLSAAMPATPSSAMQSTPLNIQQTIEGAIQSADTPTTEGSEASNKRPRLS